MRGTAAPLFAARRRRVGRRVAESWDEGARWAPFFHAFFGAAAGGGTGGPLWGRGRKGRCGGRGLLRGVWFSAAAAPMRARRRRVGRRVAESWGEGALRGGVVFPCRRAHTGAAAGSGGVGRMRGGSAAVGRWRVGGEKRERGWGNGEGGERRKKGRSVRQNCRTLRMGAHLFKARQPLG